MKLFFALAALVIACPVFAFLTGADAPADQRFSGAAVGLHGRPELPSQASRQIAITFDDLPSTQSYEVGEMKALTTKLLKILKQNRVPTIGFVNEGKLHSRPDVPGDFEARRAVLKLWVDEGFELGNHTYSHVDLFKATADKFRQDLIAGEQTTRELLAARGMKLRYFRHPFLNTGPSLEMKSAFDRILAERQYVVAPVSVDTDDYIFASVYANAVKNNDRALINRVVEAYPPYLEAVLEFYEKYSRSLLGYELKQILLVHANLLNADHFDKLIVMMKKRGYQFISLEEALRDKAYQSEDRHTGRLGSSWLRRWAITQNHQPAIEMFKLEPKVPADIKQAYETLK